MTSTNGPEAWTRSPNATIGESIKHMLSFIGDDPEREGLLETPKRVVASWEQIYGGYKIDPASVFKVFEDGACEGMVIGSAEFYSNCEHHIQPFFGKAYVGYIPNGKVIGISKLSRLVDIFARRLQIQERIGTDVVDALEKHLQPLGCGCIIKAKHFCMMCRGVGKQDSHMTTSALRGSFLETSVRNEFLSLLRMHDE